MDAASARILGTSDESFIVDQTIGVVTYTPPAGYYGTAVGSFVVYDTWGVGVQADVTATVASGCTITGMAGVTETTATEGDDVIYAGGGDIFVGGPGDGTLDGIDYLNGGPGTDTYCRGETTTSGVLSDWLGQRGRPKPKRGIPLGAPTSSATDH